MIARFKLSCHAQRSGRSLQNWNWGGYRYRDGEIGREPVRVPGKIWTIASLPRPGTLD